MNDSKSFRYMSLKVKKKIFRCAVSQDLLGKFNDGEFLNGIAEAITKSGLPCADEGNDHIIHITAKDDYVEIHCPTMDLIHGPTLNPPAAVEIDICSPPRKKLSVQPVVHSTPKLQPANQEPDICGQFGSLSPFKAKATSHSNLSLPQEDLRADDFVPLPYEEYSPRRLDFNRDGIAPLPDKTDTIVVKNLEHDFIKDHFMRTITKRCRTLNLVKDNETAVLHCSDFDDSTKTVLLKLASCEVAREVHSWSPFFYDVDNVLSFDLHYRGNNNSLHQQHCSNTVQLGFNRDGITPQQDKTDTIVVKNLEHDFIKDHFMRTITKRCRTLNLVKDNETAVLHCSDFDDSTKTVLLKLASCEVAREVHSWSPFFYDVDNVLFDLHYPARTYDEPNNRSGQQNTRFLEVLGLEPDFIKDHFVRTIHRDCFSKGLIDKSGMAVLDCSDFNASSLAVYLEMASYELAEAVLSWSAYPYDLDSVLNFRRHYPDGVVRDRSVCYTGQPPSLKRSAEILRRAVGTERKCESSTLVSSTRCETKPLNNNEATRAFLVACIDAKGTDSKFIGSTATYRIVAAALEKSYGISVSVEDCKIKMKRLQEQYRRNPLKSMWHSFIVQLRGEQDAMPPDNAMSTQTFSKAELFTRYTGEFKWDESNTKCLIGILVDLKEEFVDPHKDARFWKKVSDRMAALQLHVDPKHCQSRMNFLQARYKDIDTRRKQTGTGPVHCPYYEDLRPLLADNVSVEAMLTYSAGAVSRTTINSALSQTLLSRERTGRERLPTNLNKEEKVTILTSLNNSRDKLTESLKEVAQALNKEQGRF